MITRPSERQRWSRCTGYPAFKALLEGRGALPPETPSQASWRGTVGHTITEKELARVAALSAPERYAWACSPTDTLRRLPSYLGREYVHPDDASVTYIVDQELLDGVLMCVMAVAKALEQADEGAVLWVEKKVTVFGVSGTADVIIWSPYHRWLWVLDHKFGQGVRVSVKDNGQLQFYGVGAAFDAPFEKPERVVLGICQPAHGGVKWTHHDIAEVEAWRGKIRAELNACMSSERALAAGSWCRWCPCAVPCPAIGGAVEDAVGWAAVPTTPVQALISFEELGARLRVYEDVLMPYFAALRQALHAALESGEASPDAVGWKLVEKIGNRRWIDDHALLAWLGKHSADANLFYKHVLMSPAQVEKVIRQQKLPLPKSELAALCERPVSGQTLTRLDSPRKAAVAQPLAGLGPLPESALLPAR